MSEQPCRYLEALFSAGSFSRAAQSLGISQPSLSQFVQRLERELGAELVDRTAKPLRPTEAGEAFLEAERAVQTLREDCRKRINDIARGDKGRVVIGASEYRETYFLTEVLPIFRAAHPDVDLSLEEGTTRELEDYVAEGRADLALVVSPVAAKGLAEIDIYSERILLALAKDDPLAIEAAAAAPGEEFPPLNFSRLHDRPFIVMKKGQQFNTLFRELCEATKTKPRVLLGSESLGAALALVGAGLGAALSTETLARRSPSAEAVRFFSICPDVPPRVIVAAYHENRYLSKAARLLVKTMQRVAREKFLRG